MTTSRQNISCRFRDLIFLSDMFDPVIQNGHIYQKGATETMCPGFLGRNINADI